MRLLHRIAPRRLVLLLVPVLLVAGLAQRGSSPVVPSAAPAAPAPRLDLVPPVPAAAGPVSAPAPVARSASSAATPVRLARVSRTQPRAARTRATTAEQRGQAALAALGYDWRRLGYDVVFRPATGRTLGTANRRTRLITVYVRQGQSELSLRASIAHELGHALDFEHGDDERRAAYLRIRGISVDTPWFPCNRCDDLGSPAGDFAEVFAAWLVGPDDFRSRLAAAPGRRQLAELAPLLQIPEPASAADEPQPAPSPTATGEPRGPLPPLIGPPPSPRAA